MYYCEYVCVWPPRVQTVAYFVYTALLPLLSQKQNIPTIN